MEPTESIADQLINHNGNETHARTKDGWDRFAAVSPVLTALAVAVIGGFFTFNEGQRNDLLKQQELTEANRQIAQDSEAKKRQDRVLELQAVGQFMPYLASKNNRSNQLAITAIKALSNTEIAVELAKLNPSDGTRAALQQIATKSSNADDRMVAQRALVDFQDVHIQPLFSGGMLSKDFQEADWTTLASPDPRFEPGAVFELKGGVPRWLSSLKMCNVDLDELRPTETGFSGGSGSSKDIAYRPKTEYSPSQLLDIKGVKKGPDFDKATKAIMASFRDGVSQINEINLKQWISSHPEEIPESCKAQLTRADVFVAEESYILGETVFQLFDASGNAMDLTKALVLTPDAEAKLSDDQHLTSSTRIYAAVRGTRIYNPIARKR